MIDCVMYQIRELREEREFVLLVSERERERVLKLWKAGASALVGSQPQTVRTRVERERERAEV